MSQAGHGSRCELRKVFAWLVAKGLPHVASERRLLGHAVPFGSTEALMGCRGGTP